MPNHPLAEVFGFPTDNMSEQAERHRRNRLCPFNNKSPNCTKDSVSSPLGVCSVFGTGSDAIITCPVRFRQEWIITTDAAEFFGFPDGEWASLTEVRLHDKYGKAAGNIDVVVVRHDRLGRIVDFGALEIQAVYISGNVRIPFEAYMENPAKNAGMDWRKQSKYPRADYLSSSRKRLAPQLIYKGGILNTWGRKTAVALNTGFFKTLPILEEVEPADADIAWLIYDLVLEENRGQYVLQRHKTVYTKFEVALARITVAEAGDESKFIARLEAKLGRRLATDPEQDVDSLEVKF
ncbi:MAG: hypothetical protein M3Y56_07800 [Armatimonadota bacterium]|nr:hypothetical protein [Armatimonadota bacterium]